MADNIPDEKPQKSYGFLLLVLFVVLLIAVGAIWFYVGVIRHGQKIAEEAQESFLNTEGARTGAIDDIVVKEQTIYESDTMTIRATYFGDALDDRVHSGRIDLPCDGLFLAVDNQNEVDIKLLCDSVALNGAASTFAPELELTVPAGGEEEGMVKLFKDSRMDYRMDMKLASVENITLELRAVNADRGDVLEKTGIVNVTTTSKKNTMPKCNYGSRLENFYSGNGISLSTFGVTDPYFRDGGDIGIYVDNNTDKTISLRLEGDVDIEGVDVGGTMEDAIQAGAKGICYIRLDNKVIQNEFSNSPYEREAKADIGIYAVDDGSLLDTAKMDTILHEM